MKKIILLLSFLITLAIFAVIFLVYPVYDGATNWGKILFHFLAFLFAYGILIISAGLISSHFLDRASIEPKRNLDFKIQRFIAILFLILFLAIVIFSFIDIPNDLGLALLITEAALPALSFLVGIKTLVSLFRRGIKSSKIFLAIYIILFLTPGFALFYNTIFELFDF